jgi:hypothetical protein
MKIDKVSSFVARLFFAGASVLLIVAVLERIANASGYTMLRGTYTAARMLELATILVIFVMALLLRQIREQLKQAK